VLAAVIDQPSRWLSPIKLRPRCSAPDHAIDITRDVINLVTKIER
jgi:hypothetical protein